MLRQRILTALVLGPLVMAAIVWLPLAWLEVFIGVVVTLAALEWGGIMQLPGPLARGLFATAIATLLGLTSLAWGALPQGTAGVLLGIAAIWWLIALAWVLAYPAGLPQGRAMRGRETLAGVCMLVPAWFAVVALRAQGGAGGWLLLFLLVIIWAADIAAFFAGRAVGRHKMAPHVSPGKTWEGAAAGVAASSLIAAACALPLGVPEGAIPVFVALCAVVASFSIVGDLAVSMFKRHARLKDSGTLLPGHGGLLDRIDSLTAAAPAFLLGIKFLGLFR
ncbi:MAG TPA: phosphatidate cytidylyltransferase [Gammaproteobacteria bacterium]|nr:phosphatidate cytidylyltransferase [Gammaproteobacteria bacterium]